MRGKKCSSHESLSLEECERLVLSPPAVPFNPVELGKLHLVNRAVSAKHSLHSLDTHRNTPPIPRHASIAWSQSEFDYKFKNDVSRPKSTSFESKTLLCANSVESKNLSNKINKKGKHKKLVIYSKPSGEHRSKSWKSLLCCVSTRSVNKKNSTKLKLDTESSIRDIEIKKTSIELTHRAPNSPNAVQNIIDSSKTKQTNPMNFLQFFKRKDKIYESSTRNGIKNSANKERLKNITPFIPNNKIEGPSTSTIEKVIPTQHTQNCLIYTQKIGNDDTKNACLCSHQTSENSPNHQNTLFRSKHIDDSEESNHSDDSISEAFDQNNPGEELLGRPSNDCVGKKCLVLDLDETLVHSSFKPVENADFSVYVDIDNVQHEVLVCKRPYLDEFIEAVGPLFECVMFTASLSKYADPVCDRIDSAGHFKHRLFREACVCFKSNYIKHLAVLGRDLDQVCIIDNSPISFYFHRKNALQILSWFDDPNDTALLDLIPYLTELAAAPNVFDFLQNCHPPKMAAISQPELNTWMFAPQFINGYYEVDDDEEPDLDNGECSSTNVVCQKSIITMATRPSETATS